MTLARRSSPVLVLAALSVAACTDSEPHGASAGSTGGAGDAGVANAAAGTSGGVGAAGGALGGAAAAEAGGASGVDGAEAGAGGHGLDCGAPPAPNAWASWVMPSPASAGLPHAVSYTLSDSGQEVTDDVTGLIWQREVDGELRSWERAKSYCACLNVDGTSGWRLPSRIELVSLVDFTQANPSINAAAFPGTTNENFWTSSVVTFDEGLVYLVFFLNGHTTYSQLDYEYRTRCVRSGGPAPLARYTLKDETVYDTQTTLTWQQLIPKSLYTWADATQYCAELQLDGSGWRLPTINELQTLVDESHNPSIDLSAFPATPSEYFWSSSPVVDDATRAWTTFFTNGSTYSFGITAPKNVRCVR